MSKKQMGIILIIAGLVSLAIGIALFMHKPTSEDPKVEVSISEQEPLPVIEQVVQREEPLVDEKTDNEKKGLEFEKWVIGKFPEKYYKLIDWKGDKIVDGRYPESSRFPDLEFELQLSNGALKEKFSVECKWRKAFHDGKIHWASQEKIAIYNTYAKDRGQAVFLVLGVGGEPSAPERVYVIPLEKAQKTNLTEGAIESFLKKDPNKDFYYYAKKNTLN